MKVAGCTLRVGRPLHVARGTTMCRKERTGVCARTGDLARPLKQHKRYDVVLSDRIISRHNHWAATQGARKEEVLIQFLTHQRLQSPLAGLRPLARRPGRPPSPPHAPAIAIAPGGPPTARPLAWVSPPSSLHAPAIAIAPGGPPTARPRQRARKRPTHQCLFPRRFLQALAQVHRPDGALSGV